MYSNEKYQIEIKNLKTELALFKKIQILIQHLNFQRE